MPIPDAQRERSYEGDYMREGREAEGFVLDFLFQQPNVADVDDLRDDPHWQDRDVDFCARLMSGASWYVEAKRDAHLAGSNFLFEVLRINHTSPRTPFVLGWSFRSAAQTFALYSPEEHRIYTVQKADLVESALAFTRNVRNLTSWRLIPTDSIKSTVVLLIPKSSVRHLTYACRDGWWLPTNR